ncbi:MAG TPA: AraC family transcriptional regulator [Ideonella sp.]|uniref:AraC family transcriptional regulator n=1 Tax=Ideonella sp. TaxID=1929293 RepID=UPI002BF49438|nr:AraC family transcriptional regulator [Ideonella sp.]HSI50030.1 AraC family transcriptional regulator [Ideonella sp.]
MPSIDAQYAELTERLARFTEQAGEEGPCETQIEGFSCHRRTAGAATSFGAQWPCFGMVLQGRKSLTVGNEVYHYGVGDYLLMSVDLPVVSRILEASPERPHLGLGMAIPADRLQALLRRLPPATLTPAQGAPRGVAVHKACPALLEATLRLMRLLDTPRDIPALAPLLQEEILYRLLVGPAGGRLLHMALAETPGNKVARAAAWLREHHAEALSMDALAARVGMSVSSLHHQFKAVTNLSPLQYQKQLRLHEARRLMLLEQVTAANAGHRVGYQSPSQFSREYSRLYGRSPQRDVDALREDVPSPVEA